MGRVGYSPQPCCTLCYRLLCVVHELVRGVCEACLHAWFFGLHPNARFCAGTLFFTMKLGHEPILYYWKAFAVPSVLQQPQAHLPLRCCVHVWPWASFPLPQ